MIVSLVKWETNSNGITMLGMVIRNETKAPTFSIIIAHHASTFENMRSAK